MTPLIWALLIIKRWWTKLTGPYVKGPNTTGDMCCEGVLVTYNCLQLKDCYVFIDTGETAKYGYDCGIHVIHNLSIIVNVRC